MKIFLTGIGGPAGICFAKSLSESEGIELIGGDADEEALGKKFVQRFHKLPLANDPTFLSTLKKIIEIEKVDCLISLVDEELPIISLHIQDLNCRVLVSPYETIQYTTDKEKLYDVLNSFLPIRYTKENAVFPLFVKPKIGRGGKGAEVVKNKDELDRLNASTYIFQEILTDPEITVDTLFNIEGNLIIAVLRIRAEVQEGISVSGKIIENKEINSMIKEISALLKFVGPINFQFMNSPFGYKLTDINARSSGGMGITINAGVDIPKLALELIRSSEVSSLPKAKEGIFSNFNEIIERQKEKTVLKKIL